MVTNKTEPTVMLPTWTKLCE